MVILLVILAALAALVVGVLRDESILLYVAVGLSVVGVLVLYGPALLKRLRKGRRKPAAEETGSATEAGAGLEDSDDEAVETAPAASDDDTRHEDETADDTRVPVSLDSVVHVVPGRKRYHQDQCRILSGKDSEKVILEEAHEEGFTPCTVCFGENAVAPTPLEHSK